MGYINKSYLQTQLENLAARISAVFAKTKDIPTITNNLLTTVPGTALDAVQGKALDDKITDVNNSLINTQTLTNRFTEGAKEYTGTDWDLLKTPGCWLVLNGKDNAPISTSWCTVIVFMGGTGAYVQIALSAAGTFYIRHHNGANWLAWHEF